MGKKGIRRKSTRPAAKSKPRGRMGQRRGGESGRPARPAERKAIGEVAPPSGLIVVGIGASAGGLEAFSELLVALPSNTGAAFVLVQHLAPGHESALVNLLAPRTAMPVRQAAEG